MELAYQDWARLQGRGPRTGGPFDRTIGWRSYRGRALGRARPLQSAIEINWATCQQLADEGSQPDPTRIETPLNWPPERAGSSVEGTRLARTQKTLWRQVVKVRADKLDLKIRALQPANPVYMAWTNRDQHSTMFANVIPTEQYNLTG